MDVVIAILLGAFTAAVLLLVANVVRIGNFVAETRGTNDALIKSFVKLATAVRLRMSIMGDLPPQEVLEKMEELAKRMAEQLPEGSEGVVQMDEDGNYSVITGKGDDWKTCDHDWVGVDDEKTCFKCQSKMTGDVND